MTILQNTANRERAKIILEQQQRDDVRATAREETATGSTRMDPSPFPNWTLDEHRHKCVYLTEVKRSDSMAIDARNLVIYNRNCFEHETELGAW